MTNQPKLSPEAVARREHALWQQDFGRWRVEHRQALAMLCKVQAAILERESALEKAAAEIESHQLELGDYDLIGCGSDSPDPETELAAHAIFAQKHKLARAAYELTKTQHVNIVAEVEALFNLCQLTK